MRIICENKMFATKQEILEIIEQIQEEDLLIIVEGKKDRAALEKLGLNSFVLHGKDFFHRIQEIAGYNRVVLILTDFDKEGKMLYSKIAKELEKYGIKVNKQYREFFQRKTKLSQIEGMDTYMGNLE